MQFERVDENNPGELCLRKLIKTVESQPAFGELMQPCTHALEGSALDDYCRRNITFLLLLGITRDFRHPLF